MELANVLIIILAIFIAYFAFLYFTQKKEVPAEDFKNLVAVAVPAPMVAEPSVEIEQVRAQPEVMPEDEETPLDPYANHQEMADMPERMRNPERMFQPAPENNGMPVNSGIMGAPHSGIAGYASEMVQNEGEFMPGIVAFDHTDATNFSMF